MEKKSIKQLMDEIIAEAHELEVLMLMSPLDVLRRANAEREAKVLTPRYLWTEQFGILKEWETN